MGDTVQSIIGRIKKHSNYYRLTRRREPMAWLDIFDDNLSVPSGKRQRTAFAELKLEQIQRQRKSNRKKNKRNHFETNQIDRDLSLNYKNCTETALKLL